MSLVSKLHIRDISEFQSITLLWYEDTWDSVTKMIYSEPEWGLFTAQTRARGAQTTAQTTARDANTLHISPFVALAVFIFYNVLIS